jgi:hypothetical protein
MEIRKVAKQIKHSIMALVLIGGWTGNVMAQDGHQHQAAAQSKEPTPEQGALLKAVRDNTERFKDVAVAEAEGYSLLFGCVSGPDYGAMGLHYVNLKLVGEGVVDATRPQIIIYEPTTDGHLKMTGADFLVLADPWNKAHPGQGAPQLMGQLYHYFESPNRFGLPAFYTLHVWAWKENPNGAFVNWHPNVSCKAFAGQ